MSIVSTIIVPGQGDDNFYLVGNEIRVKQDAVLEGPSQDVTLRLTDDLGQTHDCTVTVNIGDSGLTCWSDSFTESTLDAIWDVSTGPYVQEDGQLKVISMGVANQTIMQSLHSYVGGTFRNKSEFESIDVDGSGGHDVGLCVTVGGTNYHVVFRKNNLNPTRGIHTGVGTTYTLRQAIPGSVLGVSSFEIERDAANNLLFKYNGSTVHTIAGVTGAFTRAFVPLQNNGGGASGSPTYILNSFLFQVDDGASGLKPYCTP